MRSDRFQHFQTGKKERIAYCLFFLGQNILWGYAGYVETFLTDIGISAATAAVILLVPKLWDAVNDVLFGYLMDRFTFRNHQKFIPWVRIGTSAIGITTIALFAIPPQMPETMKILPPVPHQDSPCQALSLICLLWKQPT